VTTLNYTETLEVTTCWCGIHLAMPTNLLRNAKEYGTDVYCPIGHKFGWDETKADRLQKKLDAAERQRDELRRRVAAERDLRADTERRLTAQKAATTRARKRHAAAVCPCCKRSFVQLRRHMAAKHPDYSPEATA
jgi:hypothetical protein